jgi:ketosteroid isomerase-like protein
MSLENQQLVEQIYRRMQERDFAVIPQCFDPEIEIYQSDVLPWGGRYRGFQGVANFFSRILENISSRVDTERFIDAGDCIVQVGHTRGTANRTGCPFDVPEVHLWKVRHGKITSFEAYIDMTAMMIALDAI